MTTKHEVIDLHTARPDITARQAADHLGCSRRYVTATCRRNGIKFALETSSTPVPYGLQHSTRRLERKVL